MGIELGLGSVLCRRYTLVVLSTVGVGVPTDNAWDINLIDTRRRIVELSYLSRKLFIVNYRMSEGEVITVRRDISCRNIDPFCDHIKVATATESRSYQTQSKTFASADMLAVDRPLTLWFIVVNPPMIQLQTADNGLIVAKYSSKVSSLFSEFSRETLQPI